MGKINETDSHPLSLSSLVLSSTPGQWLSWLIQRWEGWDKPRGEQGERRRLSVWNRWREKDKENEFVSSVRGLWTGCLNWQPSLSIRLYQYWLRPCAGSGPTLACICLISAGRTGRCSKIVSPLFWLNFGNEWTQWTLCWRWCTLAFSPFLFSSTQFLLCFCRSRSAETAAGV